MDRVYTLALATSLLWAANPRTASAAAAPRFALLCQSPALTPAAAHTVDAMLAAVLEPAANNGAVSRTPARCLQAAGLLEARRQLTLSGKGLRDVGPLASLDQLEALDLAHNEIEDVRPLAGLTQLKTLDLADNLIVDFTPVRSLPRLQDLEVKNNLHTMVDTWKSRDDEETVVAADEEDEDDDAVPGGGRDFFLSPSGAELLGRVLGQIIFGVLRGRH